MSSAVVHWCSETSIQTTRRVSHPMPALRRSRPDDVADEPHLERAVGTGADVVKRISQDDSPSMGDAALKLGPKSLVPRGQAGAEGLSARDDAVLQRSEIGQAFREHRHSVPRRRRSPPTLSTAPPSEVTATWKAHHSRVVSNFQSGPTPTRMRTGPPSRRWASVRG
jgi:hypothetical protein